MNNLFSYMDAFSTEDKCIEHFIQMRWHGKLVCAYCESENISFLKGKTKRFKCYNCNKQFSVTVGTIFQSSRLPLRKWFAGLYLFLCDKKGISSVQLSKNLGITQKSAWYMLQKFRDCLGEDNTGLFTKQVELDESFVGGKNKNRHADKKFKHSQGRSFKDKTPIWGALQRETKDSPKRVIAKVVPDTGERSVIPLVFTYVDKKAVVNTDEWLAYNNLRHFGYKHAICNHSAKEYVSNDGNCYTNNLENFWSHLKRGINGVYHKTSRKHLQLYANEYAFKFNNRHKVMEENVTSVIEFSIGKLLPYNKLIS